MKTRITETSRNVGIPSCSLFSWYLAIVVFIFIVCPLPCSTVPDFGTDAGFRRAQRCDFEQTLEVDMVLKTFSQFKLHSSKPYWLDVTVVC